MEKKKTHKVVLLIAVCFIMLGSSVYIANSFVIPVTSDILVLQVGDDDDLDETSELIVKNLERRNKLIAQEEEHEEQQKFNQLDLLYSTSNIDVGKLTWTANRPILLDIDVLEVSVKDLENGILDKYQTKVLIIVGHGTPEGLEDKNNNMNWDKVEDLLNKNSASFSILASCYSASIIKNVPNAFGFPNIIDGIIAAHITSALILKMLDEVSLANELMDLALNRFIELQINPELLMPLRFINPAPPSPPAPPAPPKGLDFVEAFYWISTIITTICAVLLSFWLPQKLVASIAIKFLIWGWEEIVMGCVWLAMGQINIWQFVGKCFKFVLAFMPALIDAINYQLARNFWYGLYLWITFGISMSTFIASLYVTGSAMIWVKIIAAAVSFIRIGVGIYQDILD